MKKTTLFSSILSRLAIGSGVALALFAISMPLVSQASTVITATSAMKVGSKGTDVANMQSFLAEEPAIYPQGSTDGVFGGNTKAAVVQFQVAYDLFQDGVFGSASRAKANAVINSGYDLDISVPSISNVNVGQINANSATVSWYTNENSRAIVYYSTSPLFVDDANGSFGELQVSGSPFRTAGTSYQTTQNVLLQNLSANTTYYYFVESVDHSENANGAYGVNTFHTAAN